MNNPGRNPEISEKELELALCAYANDLEGQFPESDEEIVSMFKVLKASPTPEPDARTFARMLESEYRQSTQKNALSAFAEWWQKVMTGVFDSCQLDTGGFAPMAARDGKQPNLEDQQKRQAARQANRKKNGNPPHGSA